MWLGLKCDHIKLYKRKNCLLIRRGGDVIMEAETGMTVIKPRNAGSL